MKPCFKEGNGLVANYDISPSHVAEISLELWFKLDNIPTGSKCWLIGHDNGGYDRAITVCDPRHVVFPCFFFFAIIFLFSILSDTDSPSHVRIKETILP